ncbi:MAG: peptide chain release factor N(5)-glutamine methyltransferase, partial [Bacteroidia bacterium]
MSTNKVSSIVNLFKKRLSSIYDERELQNIIHLCFEHIMAWDKMTFRQKQDDALSESELLHFNSIIKRLQKNEPIQYIMGHTEFYGLRFLINDNVLIPRPETEELVDLMVKENKHKSIRILDVGTGSGCIAVALKKNLPQSTVVAIDASNDAIEVARQNAKKNNVEVAFITMDIFSEDVLSLGKFDVIVSNPPYITKQEQNQMREHVLAFEPHQALFVNHSPLEFYERICELST